MAEPRLNRGSKKSETAAGVEEAVKTPRRKPQGRTVAERASTKDGLKTTRSNSASRGEIRRQTVHRKGHPK